MRFEMKLTLTAVALGALAGCAPVDAGLGEALRYDMEQGVAAALGLEH